MGWLTAMPLLLVVLVICLCNEDVAQEVYSNPATNELSDGSPTEKETPVQEKKDPITIDLNKRNFNTGITNNKTRMLLYEYSMESETLLIDEKSPKDVKLVSKINATYAFEIIHYDKDGNILARYRLLKCHLGPCDYRMPDIYVDFIQGGNNIIGVFASLNDDEKPSWNPLLSIVNTINTPAISGAGDEQNVITPYGLCHYRFWRPQDMKFKRRINNCYLDGVRNHSLIPGATIHSYEQNVIYIQNMKIDADIVLVDAEETLLLSSPISDKFSLKVYSKTFLEMTKRNRTYDERLCPSNETASQCAENSIGATRLGRNWKEIRQNIQMGIVRRPTKVESVMRKYRKQVLATKNSEKRLDAALLFGELVNAVILASKDELTTVLKDAANRPVLGIFANALASAGTVIAHRFAREMLLIEEPQHAKRYLESLALTTKINEAIVDDLKEWLAEEIKLPSKSSETENNENLYGNEAEDNSNTELEHEKELKTHIAFTLANLLYRYCQSSTSRLYACNKGKDKNVNEFLASTTTCNDANCHRNALQILANIPTAGVVPYARQFLCSQDNTSQLLQKTALRLLSLVDANFIDTPVINRLLRIFRDACPLPQSTTDQTLATDVLMNAVPQYASIGTYLLRSESLQPDNHEKWAYFYDSVAQRRLANEKVDDYWATMRKFRVFRPNYLHRSLIASSNVFGIKITEKSGYGVRSISKTEFNGGIFKRSDFLLSVIRSNNRCFPLLGVTTDTAGLSDYIAESDSLNEQSDAIETPEATVQLNFFNARLPPITVFEGYTGLLSAVWSADGSPIEGHDTNIIWRQFINVIPLLSGITLTNDIIGSTSIRLSGSSQISLWNRASSSSMITNVSASLDSKLTLCVPSGVVIGDITSRLSASGSVVLDLDVDFYSEPYLFCTIVSQGPVRFRQSVSHVIGNGSRRGLSSTITLPGRSFALNERITRMCNEMLQHK